MYAVSVFCYFSSASDAVGWSILYTTLKVHPAPQGGVPSSSEGNLSRGMCFYAGLCFNACLSSSGCIFSGPSSTRQYAIDASELLLATYITICIPASSSKLCLSGCSDIRIYRIPEQAMLTSGKIIGPMLKYLFHNRRGGSAIWRTSKRGAVSKYIAKLVQPNRGKCIYRATV